METIKETKDLNIYQRLAKARQFVATQQNNQLGKGYNFKYYTPEQVDTLANKASAAAGVEFLFDLLQDELGYYGRLKIVNIDDPKDEIIQHQRTDIPEMKSCNKCQQFGAMRTYTERYMLQSALRINTEQIIDIDDIKHNIEYISERQKAELRRIVDASGLSTERIREIIQSFGAKSSHELTSDKLLQVISKIQSEALKNSPRIGIK